jgi:hypothetical protein
MKVIQEPVAALDRALLLRGVQHSSALPCVLLSKRFKFFGGLRKVSCIKSNVLRSKRPSRSIQSGSRRGDKEPLALNSRWLSEADPSQHSCCRLCIAISRALHVSADRRARACAWCDQKTKRTALDKVKASAAAKLLAARPASVWPTWLL